MQGSILLQASSRKSVASVSVMSVSSMSDVVLLSFNRGKSSERVHIEEQISSPVLGSGF